VLAAVMESLGIDIDIVADGKQAVEAWKHGGYDLVLMDIQMPELDGISATRALRADTRYANLPIIAMTAHAMTGDRELSLQAGMSDHITKPIDPDQLYATLARWLLRRATEPYVTEARDSGAASELGILAPLVARGIDVDRGLARYLNRKSFYINVLHGFVSEYGAAVPKLKELHAVAAREEIFRLAHTLKANAEGIGASALAEAARSVEDTAKGQLPDAGAISTLTNALAHVLSALETITPEHVEFVETASAPLDVVAGMKDLVQRLEQDDAVSLDVVRQLQRVVRNSPHAEAVNELELLIEDVEYAQASACARALLRDLLDAQRSVV
jgi:two-component system sensor histidine kinase/response regulator